MKIKFNKYILILIIASFALLIGASFIILQNKNKTIFTNNQNISNEEIAKTNHKAAFAIYTNGTFRIFTDSMYHDLSPDVFIQSSNPNIIYVKKSNITWRDFFSTLPFSINENCLITGTKQTFCTNNQFSLQFYINGVRDNSALDQKINPGDKLLVTYDIQNLKNLQLQLQSIPEIN